MSNCCIGYEKCACNVFPVQLRIHINTISINYHKVTPMYVCSEPCGSNSVVVFLCQEKNGNEYDNDLKIEIHLVIRHV